jgi:hypothetical protein
LIRLVRSALGDFTASCPSGPGRPGVADLVRAVRAAMNACAASAIYRLIDPSTILYSPPPPGSAPPVSEPLSGSLTVVRTPDPLPNSLVALSVVGANFHSTQHLVVNAAPDSRGGCAYEIAAGCLTALTFDFPPHLYVSLALSIDGMNVGVFGGGELEEELPGPFPPIRAIELCGGIPNDRAVFCDDLRSGRDAGYILTLSFSATVEKPQR